MPTVGTSGLRASVAMTTYRGGAYVVEQLESILTQTRAPDEVVVHDDASDDGTWERLTEYVATLDAPVRLHRNEVNVGLRRNVEAALQRCTGDVVVLADQDDLWQPDKLAVLMAAFESDPATTLWFSDAELVDASGTPTGRTAWDAVHFGPEEQARVRSGDVRRLVHGQTVTGATMAFRASVLDRALPLPDRLDGEDHLFLHDGWIAVIAACLGHVAVEPRALTRYRQHPDQLTAMSMSGAWPAGAAARDPRRWTRSGPVWWRPACRASTRPRLARWCAWPGSSSTVGPRGDGSQDTCGVATTTGTPAGCGPPPRTSLTRR